MRTLSLLLLLALIILATACGTVVPFAQTSAPAAMAPSTQPVKELTLDLGDKVMLKLVRIPTGKFLMGSPETEKDRDKNEVQHEVTISKPFYMGITHVTVDQYGQFLKHSGYRDLRNPTYKQMGDHPVVQVGWNEAQAFCTWLSKRRGKVVTLPTEAQWEYACRAGSTTRFYFGDDDKELGKYAWFGEFGETGARAPHPVGQKKPNAWGLYDMHGNANQWCHDNHGDYDKGPTTDPIGRANPVLGIEGNRFHVLRGGSWYVDTLQCRSASRNGSDLDTRDTCSGFRVVVAVDTLNAKVSNVSPLTQPRSPASQPAAQGSEP